MIVISTRKDFTDADHLCENRVIKEITLPVNVRDVEIPNKSLSDNEFINKLTGEKILIIVHGYNNPFKKILKTYKKIIAELNNEYDHIIGFAWAGGNHINDYYRAKDKIDGVGDELKNIIDLLVNNSKIVDVMAHSLGNAVVFDAFKEENTIARNLFSFAAAVNNDSLNKDGLYNNVTNNVKDIFICYSKRDSVTGIIYKTANMDFTHGTLGHELPLDLEYFVSEIDNVHFINCSNVISKHGAYKNSSNIYSFVRDMLKFDHNFTFKTL